MLFSAFLKRDAEIFMLKWKNVLHFLLASFIIILYLEVLWKSLDKQYLLQIFRNKKQQERGSVQHG